MYRFERDGWTIDDVAVEMRRQTYRYGWLPGYMYAMAKNKPSSASTRRDAERNGARTAAASSFAKTRRSRRRT